MLQHTTWKSSDWNECSVSAMTMWTALLVCTNLKPFGWHASSVVLKMCDRTGPRVLVSHSDGFATIVLIIIGCWQWTTAHHCQRRYCWTGTEDSENSSAVSSAIYLPNCLATEPNSSTWPVSKCSFLISDTPVCAKWPLSASQQWSINNHTLVV